MNSSIQWDESRVLPRYGQWTIIGRSFGKRHSRRIPCRCDCGNTSNVLFVSLKLGRSTRCQSCARKSIPGSGRIKHGHTIGGKWSAEYSTWHGILTRCSNANRDDYGLYGGRGIKVCDRWRFSFENFLADVGPKPSPSHSLDRINNDGNYEPGNVRWATPVQQANNRRPRTKVFA